MNCELQVCFRFAFTSVSFLCIYFELNIIITFTRPFMSFGIYSREEVLLQKTMKILNTFLMFTIFIIYFISPILGSQLSKFKRVIDFSDPSKLIGLDQARLVKVRLGQVRLDQVRLGYRFGKVRLGFLTLGQVKLARLGQVCSDQLDLELLPTIYFCTNFVILHHCDL